MASSNTTDFSSLNQPVGSSPISRVILDTNNPPAEANLSSIREFVSRGSARREVLDAKIGSLKAELEKLLEERNFLDTEIRKHEGALSPLRRMPTEIISLIFTFATPPVTPSNNLMDVQEGPWVLSAVCGRWRTIILSSPWFWTSLYLDFTDDDPELPSFAGVLPMLEAQLERSQRLPLNITFYAFDDYDCTEREREVLELLALHCDRWETIKFTGPPVMYRLLEDIRDSLHILRKLDIAVPETTLEFMDLFQSCPRLEEAFVNAGGYGEDRSWTAELPFAQLRRYSASNPWPTTSMPFALHPILWIVCCMFHDFPRSPQQAPSYYHTSFAYPYRQMVFCITWIPLCSRSCTAPISPTPSTPF
ncbi:hypothetical protein B0H19DRAFT_16957 [Mycena capillaripes]|nr:hypothetical protein B0H19DRAFT_16957 [Mycena capillaripes]